MLINLLIIQPFLKNNAIKYAINIHDGYPGTYVILKHVYTTHENESPLNSFKIILSFKICTNMSFKRSLFLVQIVLYILYPEFLNSICSFQICKINYSI